jgi:KDO2-lipid IV(A) lauroyltransferase
VKDSWKEKRHRLEARGLDFVSWIVPQLSRQGSMSLGNLLGDLAYFFDRRGRGIALENLDCAFGDRYSTSERKRIARASYQNFARTMVDLFWAQNITPANYRDYLRLEVSRSAWLLDLSPS